MNTMQLYARHRAAAAGMGGFAPVVGLGGFWEDFGQTIIEGGFDFGNRFLGAYEARGVARAGQNPYYNPYVANTGAGAAGSTLTAEQVAEIARRAAAGEDPAGPAVGKGLSKAWNDLAKMFGVESSTLTLMAAGGFVLLYMTPPRKK